MLDHFCAHVSQSSFCRHSHSWQVNWNIKGMGGVEGDSYIYSASQHMRLIDGWVDVDKRAEGMDGYSLKTEERRGWCRWPIILRGWQHTGSSVIEEYACVRGCVRAYESDSDSDLPIKVVQERNGVMGQKERKRGKERHMETREKRKRWGQKSH